MVYSLALRARTVPARDQVAPGRQRWQETESGMW